LLELTQADTHEILALPRSLVIGILAEVAQRRGDFQGLWQFLAQLFFQRLDFFF